MLSKIIRGEEIKKLELNSWTPPLPEEVDDILYERRQEAQRRRIIDDTPDDPLKAAKAEATRILTEAQDKLKSAQVETIAMKARLEADIRKSLEKDFQQKLDAEIAKLRQNYNQTVEALAVLQQAMFEKNEHDLLEMVFTITRKVIGAEIKTSPQVVLEMLKKGFDKLKEAREFLIKLNSADYESLMTQKTQLKEVFKTSGNVRFEKDDRVERGGCKIITDSGEISSEPGKILDIIRKELSDET